MLKNYRSRGYREKGDSQRKDQDTRNLQSKETKQQHQEQVDFLQSLSTPVKRKSNPKDVTKKLLPVRENIVTAATASVQKQGKDSSKEESTESDTSEIQAKK